MQNFDLENIKSHPSLSLAKAKSRGDNKYGSATQSGRSLLPESGADAPTVLSAVYTDSTPAKNRQADVPQYGRSMIEMLGVLAIIGVLSVGGIAGYSKAMQKYRINKAIEQITLISGNIRSFFAPQRNYEGLGGCVNDNANCKVIRKAKLVPDEVWTYYDSDQPWGAKAGDFKEFTNVFGASFALGCKDKSKTGDKQAFHINYQIDNIEACIELTSHDWTTANVGVIEFGNNGPQASGKAYFKPPMDIDTAVERCSAFFKASNNVGCSKISLDFYFDIDVNSTYWQGLINPS